MKQNIKRISSITQSATGNGLNFTVWTEGSKTPQHLEKRLHHESISRHLGGH